ncbi:MAG: hypothetical protein AB7P23_04240 [Amphiplicatus sp.]
MQKPTSFLCIEDGLVTIEWIAIAAVAFVAAVSISATVFGGTQDLGGAVAGHMSAAADGVSP